MKLLQNEKDISLLVNNFYHKVLEDELLAPFFEHAMKHNWETHLEVMNRFWNNILFYTGGYFGTPLQSHQVLHHFKALQPQHFERWLLLFNTTVDELFTGKKAELAKARAYSIAIVMQMKVLAKDDGQVDEPVY
jgi:hemoglobin